jgi:carbon-monoxide dehydrogenase medium subunit
LPAAVLAAVGPAGYDREAPRRARVKEMTGVALVKPSPFEYHAPDSVAEAVALLGDLGDGAKVLAGGQSLVPLLSLRLTSFDHLVDVGRIPEMRGISANGASVRVGAATIDAAVEHDADIAAKVPLLAKATPYIGHFQIRNRGTVGGSIAHADPAAELPAVALTLDAEMEAASPRGRRTIPAQEFFQGFWTSALEPDEVLASVTFPVWGGRTGFGVQEFARRHGDFAIAGAVVGVQLDDADRVSRCAIGLIGLGQTPLRAAAAEQAAVGATVEDVVAAELGIAAVAGLDEVPSDVHAPAGYRKRVGAAMVERAWRDAIEDATGGDR